MLSGESMFRRKNPSVTNDEPRWLTDYRNKYILDYERRIAAALHEGFEGGETVTAEGRGFVIDSKVKSEAYVCLTNQRFLCTFLNTRKPWQSPTPFEIPLQFVAEVVPDDEGVSVLVKVLAAGSDDTTAFVLHTGRQGAELRSALLAAADAGRGIAALAPPVHEKS